MINERDKKEITPEVYHVTWDQVNEFIYCLTSVIQTQGKSFTGVYGPARGGLVFAVILSHKLNLPFLGAPQPGCLIVDDICDTGNTALAWKDKGYYIATMFYKKGAKVTPDYWNMEKGDLWIKFPWE